MLSCKQLSDPWQRAQMEETMRNLVPLAAAAALFVSVAPLTARAEQFNIDCPGGQNLEVTYDIARGSNNKPLLNLEPRIVGVHCTTGPARFRLTGLPAEFISMVDLKAGIKFFADMIEKSAAVTSPPR